VRSIAGQQKLSRLQLGKGLFKAVFATKAEGVEPPHRASGCNGAPPNGPSVDAVQQPRRRPPAELTPGMGPQVTGDGLNAAGKPKLVAIGHRPPWGSFSSRICAHAVW